MSTHDEGLWRRARRIPKNLFVQGWRPLAPWQRGAFLGATLFALIIALSAGSQMHFGPVEPLARLGGFVAGVCIMLGLFLGARLILAIAPLFLRIPWVIIGAAAIAWIAKEELIDTPDSGYLWAMLCLLSFTAFGAAVAHLAAGKWAESASWARGLIIASCTAEIVCIGYAGYWITNPGYDDHIEPVDTWEATGALAGVSNPGAPGNEKVLTLTYGSGTDSQRPEFGSEVAFKTPTVDATDFAKFGGGVGEWLRHWYWGFDLKTAPLNARVWYPEGDGPWPLVLIVHGNHIMNDHSDPGYAYLGEHLASHGYIMASVDENFLNGYWASSATEENDGRAWVLLEHLKQWRTWNSDPDHPFYKKVDLDKIALIGHSRGGEAAATAAAFNTLAYYPDDATIEFDYNFNIRGVIAIAPSDGQYRPSYKHTPLRDVNYFTLSGGHDADVSSFVGSKQYNRVELSPDTDRFKASVWIQRANHGQFNETWGNEDSGFPNSLALNKKALMSGEDQRIIAKVYFKAFLDAIVHERDTYMPLFLDPAAGAEWLPPDHYVSRYSDATRQIIADFDEDIDLASASMDGASIEATGFGLRKEHYLDMRDWGSTNNTALYIGWRKGEEEGDFPTLAINLPKDRDAPNVNTLTFSMARIDESVPKPDEDEESSESDEAESADNAEEDEDATDEDIDWNLAVHVTLNDGSSASVDVKSIRPIPPILRSKFTKYTDETHRYSDDWEATYQDYFIPLEAFGSDVATAGSTAIQRIELRFEPLAQGVVALDDMGFINME